MGMFIIENQYRIQLQKLCVSVDKEKPFSLIIRFKVWILDCPGEIIGLEYQKWLALKFNLVCSNYNYDRIISLFS